MHLQHSETPTPSLAELISSYHDRILFDQIEIETVLNHVLENLSDNVLSFVLRKGKQELRRRISRLSVI